MRFVMVEGEDASKSFRSVAVGLPRETASLNA